MSTMNVYQRVTLRSRWESWEGAGAGRVQVGVEIGASAVAVAFPTGNLGSRPGKYLIPLEVPAS